MLFVVKRKMSSASVETGKKCSDMDIATNSQNMHSESQKTGENNDKHKNKQSSESQGNCYW